MRRTTYCVVKTGGKNKEEGECERGKRASLCRRVYALGGGNVFVQKNLFFKEHCIPVSCTWFLCPETPVFTTV